MLIRERHYRASFSLPVADVAKARITNRAYFAGDMPGIRPSIVIWQMNGRALNKHAVVVAVLEAIREHAYANDNARDRGDRPPQFFY